MNPVPTVYTESRFHVRERSRRRAGSGVTTLRPPYLNRSSLSFPGSCGCTWALSHSPEVRDAALPGFLFGNWFYSLSAPSARGRQCLCQGTVFSGHALGWRCHGHQPQSLPAATMTRFPQTQSQPHGSRLRITFSSGQGLVRVSVFSLSFPPPHTHFLFFLPLSSPPPHLSALSLVA